MSIRHETEHELESPLNVPNRAIGMRAYGIKTAESDRWGGDWVGEAFRKRGITVVVIFQSRLQRISKVLFNGPPRPRSGRRLRPSGRRWAFPFPTEKLLAIRPELARGVHVAIERLSADAELDAQVADFGT